MKTDIKNRLYRDFLDKIVNVTRVLMHYTYDKDYSIERSDEGVIVQMYNTNLRDELKHKNIIQNNKIILRYTLPKRQICVLPRPVSLESIEKENEIKGSAIFSRLLPTNKDPIYIVIIDDLSRDYVLSSYFLSLYIDKYGSRELDLALFNKYLREIIKFKNIMNEIKNLKRMLKAKFDPELHDKYLIAVNQLDSITPNLAELWEKNKDLFDRIHDIVEEADIAEEEILERITRLRNRSLDGAISLMNKYLIKKINTAISSIINNNYFILKLSSIISNDKEFPKDADKLYSIQQYLKNILGCEDIFLVDSEEYYVLIQISRLPIIPIILF